MRHCKVPACTFCKGAILQLLALHVSSAHALMQEHIDLRGLIEATDNGPVITLSVYGNQGRLMTIKETGSMSFEDLAAIHTVRALCVVHSVPSSYADQCLPGDSKLPLV